MCRAEKRVLMSQVADDTVQCESAIAIRRSTTITYRVHAFVVINIVYRTCGQRIWKSTREERLECRFVGLEMHVLDEDQTP